MVDTLTLPKTETDIRHEVADALVTPLRRLTALAAKRDLPPDLVGALELAQQAIEDAHGVAGGDYRLRDAIAMQEWRRAHG